MHAIGAGRPDRPARRLATSGRPPPTGPVAAWWKLGADVGALGIEGTAGYLSPSLGAVLAAVDVVVSLAIAVVLVGTVLLGSRETCDRVFRLLRWVANRPEPPAPGDRRGLAR